VAVSSIEFVAWTKINIGKTSSVTSSTFYLIFVLYSILKIIKCEIANNINIILLQFINKRPLFIYIHRHLTYFCYTGIIGKYLCTYSSYGETACQKK
jgi:hypothetical protein